MKSASTAAPPKRRNLFFITFLLLAKWLPAVLARGTTLETLGNPARTPAACAKTARRRTAISVDVHCHRASPCLRGTDRCHIQLLFTLFLSSQYALFTVVLTLQQPLSRRFAGPTALL
jgi:hypothetical protein